MQQVSLIYVSASRLTAATAEDEIARLVSLSAEHNAQVGITGALLHSGSHFVQILEGPEVPVRELMDRIRRDPRHEQVDMLEFRHERARAFPGWSMAYCGTAVFVQARVDELLNARQWGSGLPTAVRRMRSFLQEFARAGPAKR